MRRLIAATAILASALALGCADAELPPEAGEEEEQIDPEFFDNELQFKDNGNLQTVGDLIRARACSTAPATNLSMQIAQELACLAPNRWARIDVSNVNFGSAAYPFMSADAAAAFIGAVRELGRPISVNSTWRSVAQQHTLDSWEGSCGIGIAATPGRSMHESGLAIDVANWSDAEVRRVLRRHGFRWYCDERNGGRTSGCRDKVHFTYRGGMDLRQYTVKAFQELHNRNAAGGARISSDGAWGGNTRRALERAPLAGFPVVGNCGLDFGVGNGPGSGLGEPSPPADDTLPAPYRRAWVGSACGGDDTCDFSHDGQGGFCVAARTPQNDDGGVCSLRCEGTCPDRPGYGTTFCVSAQVMGLNQAGGTCAIKANRSNRNCDAIPGTVAMDAARYVGRSGASARSATVCVPEVVDNTVMPDPSGPEPWVGHLCSGDHQCGFTAAGVQGRCFLEHGPATGMGFCTVPCAGQCPDRQGEAQTFCVAASDAGGRSSGGVCVSRAGSENGNCSRPGGFTAVSAPRHVGNSGAAATSRTVCLPVESQQPAQPDPGPDPDPDPVQPPPVSGAEAVAACEALIEALVDRVAQVCGADRAAYEREVLDSAVGGSCNNVVGVRNAPSLYRDCLPWLASASCNALNTALPAACREQLYTQ